MKLIKGVIAAVRSFFEKIIDRLRDPSRSFKERVFILLTMVTDVVIIFALVGDIIYKESMAEIIAIIATILLVPVITFIAVRKKKVQAAVLIIVSGMVFLLLPILFYFGGGVEGGGVLWLIFAYLYTGLVLSGMWRGVMVVVLTIEAIGFYLDAYFHPERVVQHSRSMFYVDSLLSIIIVGLVCCLMVWFEEWLFSEENKRARKEAEKVEEINRSQNRFFSSMSHEIRTPINTILGSNELILRQEDASDEIIKDANNIQGAGKMLLALINDILDFSKIEAGSMDIVPVEYRVGDLVSEIVNMIWLKAQEKGLAFHVYIDPNVPSGLYGDEVRIKQILINLLNNAVKYTQEGSVTLHVESEYSVDNQVLLNISVIDTGMGIKQESLPYLFDAFRRVDQEKNRFIEGTGLGLSIVKQLVELMGGEITVNSVYTQGSTFTVSLMQNISDPDAVGDINISSDSDAVKRTKYEASFIAPECRILIVDDNEMNLQVEQKLLQDTIIMIDTATSALEALGKTLSLRYDVILMDHLMPEMDGIECLKRIRSQTGGLNQDVPVVVLTANAGSQNRELYNTSGFDGYLVKPVSGMQLERTLLMHLPEEKVIRLSADSYEKEEMNTAKGYRRKIPVLIASSTTCDLPDTLVAQLQIELLPFLVDTDDYLFRDKTEIVSDELIRYMSVEGHHARSTAPDVEDYVAFFSGLLRRSQHVIYISMADGASRDHALATEAAQTFENVTVIDSGGVSSATGILTLIAYKLAQQNEPVEKIISELQTVRKKIHCSFILADTGFMTRSGYINERRNAIMKTLWLRPSIRTRNNRLTIGRIFMGSRLQCYEKYIRMSLPIGFHPDPDVLFVTYADIAEEELVWIEEEIRKRSKFSRIIFQKATAAIASNCGPGTFGLLYMDKGEKSYHLDTLFGKEREGSAENQTVADARPATAAETAESAQNGKQTDGTGAAGNAGAGRTGNAENTAVDDTEEPAGTEWYETLTGIDGREALKNSGGEETLRFALQVFYDSIEERKAELCDFYSKEDWKNYTIKVHALKSSARIIGAKDLSDKALRLEEAGKAGNTGLIRKEHEQLMADYQAYREYLSGLFENPAEENDTQEERPVADAALMESVYETLKEGAQDMDYSKLEDAFAEMEGYEIPEAEAEKYKALKACFDGFDYDGMLALL
ncbi:MAG: DegV family EDD domain-containing protein [Lachnospiraceae bacterium]|nr:DegV family EDD domain-containing protein [Lachnospiraceae bacterium]